MLSARGVGDTGIFFFFDRQRTVIEKFAGIIVEQKGALVRVDCMSGGSFVAVNHWVQFFVEQTDGLGTGLDRFSNYSVAPFDPENDIPFYVQGEHNAEIFVWLCQLRDLWSIRNVERDPQAPVMPGSLSEKMPLSYLSFANIKDAVHFKLRWIG